MDKPEWFPIGQLEVRFQKAHARKSRSLVEEYDRREIPAGQVKIVVGPRGFELRINGSEYRIELEALFEQALVLVQANQEAMAGVAA